MALNKELLQILACPKCKGTLGKLGEEGLACPSCGIVYPVRDDIPIMLVEEAVPAADWDAGKRSVKE